ncbi:Endothelial cell-specific molecule 1 [Branchiostoma belcheri]|nr:Endothelial cell-specific molecule 1 [Branchiostoma belcheri]
MASLLAVTTPTERFEKSCFFDGYSQKPTGFLDIALADTGSMTLQLDQLVHMFTMEENCTMIFRCPVPGRILPEDAPEKVCEIVDSENLPLTTLHTRVDYNRTKYPELNRGTYSEEGDPIVEVIAVGSITNRPIKIHCHVSNYTSEDLNGPVGPVDFTFRINVKACPAGKYGKNCRQPCSCQHGALCHSFTGACHCAPGWTGVHCTEPKSEAGITSNKGLVEPSYVSENVTMTCRGYNLYDVTNITWYKDGSEVIGSDRINVTVSYTNETQLQSTIVLPYVMDDDEGLYSCVAMTSEQEVEHKANKTITVKGCPDGMYGEQCEETCDCAAQSTCYRYRGCVCLPGRTGPTCEQLCDDPALVELQGKKWGENCSNSCTCENEGLCDIQFGNCSCGNGFTGENCEFDCPDGTFGNNCTENCTCAEGEICSKVTGDCLKQPSIADEDWFIPVMSFAGVFVFLVVIAIYLTVKVRRRKAKKYLKLEGEEDTLEVVKRVVQEENSSSFRQVTVEEILTWEISREEVLTERMLGQGAFGDVLQARWTRGAMQEGGNGITVAAKKMRDCSSTKAVRDFLKEAYHLINIGHHRNIVNIHGICLQEGDFKPRKAVTD